MPLVSVIIPVKDRPRLLARAVKSVLAQSFRDFELLVVDDGSEPPLGDLVFSFGDPRIKYIRNQRPLGPGPARNRGAQEARGEVLAFLDSDDLWFPDRLDRGLRPILEGEAEITWGPGMRLKASGSVDKRPWSPNPLVCLVVWNFLPHSNSVLILKDAFFRLGGFPDMPAMEDWSLYQRALLRLRGSPCSGPLFVLVAHRGARHMSGSVGWLYKDYKKILENYKTSEFWPLVGRAKGLFYFDRYLDLSLMAVELRAFWDAVLWAAKALFLLPAAHWHLPLYPWFLRWARAPFRLLRALIGLWLGTLGLPGAPGRRNRP